MRQQIELSAYWSKLAIVRREHAEAVRSRGAPDRPDGTIESWAELATLAKDQAAWHTERISETTAKVPYYTQMRRKWERAVHYPWLPVEPDPPPP